MGQTVSSNTETLGTGSSVAPQKSSEQTAQRNIVVSLDGAPTSRKALEWAINNYKEHDVLHLVTVTERQPGPYPPEVLDCDLPGPSTQDVNSWKKKTQEAHGLAKAILTSYEQEAHQRGVPPDRIKSVELPPCGGASGVGESIVRYTKDTNGAMVVLGSRNLGGMKSLVMQMIGLGSVSEYTLKHSQVPVVIVKADGLHDTPP